MWFNIYMSNDAQWRLETMTIGKLFPKLEVAGKVIMTAYANEVYYMVPFTLHKPMQEKEVMAHAWSNVKHKTGHFAGCGYAKRPSQVYLTSPVTGWLEFSEYNGIGD